MRTRSAEAVVHLMVARDPHQSADIILGFLMGVNGARAGAIFSADGGLLVGHSISQAALDWTLRTRQQDEAALRQGRLSRSDECFLVPVTRGDRLVALVYLGTTQLDLESIAEISGPIADAVTRSAHQASSSPVESYLEQTPAREIERRKLLLLLDRHEWNVARVAREMEVTRTTVYKRLEAFGIVRKRVAKDGRSPLPS
jgi:Bacterial regulatory protein, Fis family